jgi:hypothetical protein
MNPKRVIPALLSTLVLVLALPALAAAATRHAAPDGDGPVATCPAADPCALVDALAYNRLHDGDEVVLAGGDYTVSEQLGIEAGVFVHGPATGTPARIFASVGYALSVYDPEARLSDFAIEYDGPFGALNMVSGLAERIVVHAEDYSVACYLRKATLRDSVCWSGTGIGLRSGVGNPNTETVHLRNVTAVSTGAASASVGLYLDGFAGGHYAIDAKGVIASGNDQTAEDVYVDAGGAGAIAEVNLASSSYDTVLEAGNGQATEPGSGANQTDPPLLVDPAHGDFRELAGSPTIDKGALDELSGSLDLAGAPRVAQGGADIGAFEYSPPPTPAPDPDPQPAPGSGSVGTGGAGSATAPRIAPVALDTAIVKAPPRRTFGHKARFRFAATGPATGFECSLDRAGFLPCASPFAVRVGPGAHRLRVRAVGAEGVDSTPATARWRLAGS